MPPVIGIVAAVAGAAASSAAASLGALAASLIGSAVSLATSVGLNAVFKKDNKAPFEQAAQGRSQITRQPVMPRRTIYGEVRVAGSLIFIDTKGDTNDDLGMVLTLASHPVQSVSEMEADNKAVPLGGDADISNDVKQGSLTQPASALMMAHSPNLWGSSHVLRNIAYMAMVFKFNPDRFVNGIPNVTVKVQGKVVFDPRTGTNVFSSNPALCIRDYLLDPELGLGAEPPEIDDASVIAAANICDELTVNGTRYTLNGTVEADELPEDVLRKMLTAMAGEITYTAGQYRLFAGTFETPTITLTEDDTRGDVQLEPRISRRELFNQVKGIYFEPLTNVPAEFTPVRSQGFVDQDNGEELPLNIELPFTNDERMARSIARIELERNRRQETLIFPANWTALRLQAHDTVKVSLARFGFVEKTFRVKEWAIAKDGEGVDLVLRAEDATVYTTAVETQIVRPPVPGLPDPSNISPPTNLLLAPSSFIQPDGTVVARLTITWTPSTSPFLDGHEVQIKKATDSEFEPLIRVAKGQNSITIDGLEAGVAYDARVRSINFAGVRSGFISNNETAITDGTPPGIVTDVALVTGIKELHLTFTAPADRDIASVRIFLRTTDVTPTLADLHANLSIEPDEKMTFRIGDLIGSTTYFVFLQTVDRSGNVGSLQGSFAASTRRILADDIEDAILNTAKFAQDIEPVSIVNGLPDPNGYAGPQVVFDTVTNKVFQYDPTVPEFKSPGVEDFSELGGSIAVGQIPDGVITEAKVADNAITAAKVSANAIGANELAANSVIAGKIAAGAVSADQIAAGQIFADKMAANSVTAANGAIEDAAIATAKIQTAAIDTLRLKNASVTNPVIGFNGQFLNICCGGMVSVAGATITIDSPVNPVMIWASCSWQMTFTGSFSGAALLEFQVIRDGISLTGTKFTTGNQTGFGGTSLGVAVINHRDFVSAGVHTYFFQVSTGSTPGLASALSSINMLNVTEIKR